MIDSHFNPDTRRGRLFARGFTMVELVVALGAGLMVSLAAFVLAKNATQLFQHEARISGAQLSATLGMNRLKGDLQLAGHLSTPNILNDRKRCPLTSAGTPPDWADVPALTRLAGVAITKGTTGVAELAQSEANGFHPDSIVIGGSFNTTHQFPVEKIVPEAGGGRTVFLWPNSEPMARTIQRSTEGGNTLEEVFAIGRFLRIVDKDSPFNHHEWGIITGLDTSLGNVQIHLSPSPRPRKKCSGSSVTCDPDDEPLCGFTGLGDGTLANPVSRIKYEIRSLAGHARYGRIVTAINPEVTGDDGRTELVRVELDDAGNEIANSLELVAEYAVDLKFGITAISDPNAANPTIERHPIVEPEDDAVYNIGGDLAVANTAPDRVIAVQVRLSTRTRAPDRREDLTVAGIADGRRARFLIPGVPAPAYARLRTHYADVGLPNMVNMQWAAE